MLKPINGVLDWTLTIIAFVVFCLCIPAIVVSLSNVLLVYGSGFDEFSPIGVKAVCAAVGTLIITWLICNQIKANKSFIRQPAILTFIAAVALPLSNGAQKAFSSSPQEVTLQQGDYQKSLAGIDMLKNTLLTDVPPLLCVIAIVMLATGLTLLIRKRYLS